MSGTRFKRFKRLSFYAGSCHWQYGDIVPGSLVLIGVELNDGSERLDLCKVLAIATHGGDGQPIGTRKDPYLAVMASGDALNHGYLRLHPKSSVRQLVTPGAFTRWFLFGETPSPELMCAISNYGALSNGVAGFPGLERYLTSPEGAIREDWHEVAMGRAK